MERINEEELEDILYIALTCLRQNKLRERVGIHLDLSDEYLANLYKKLNSALCKKK